MAKQVITSPSGERLIVIPEAEYRAMFEKLEDLADAASVLVFKERLVRGEVEMLPSSMVDRIISGENKFASGESTAA